ncbi:MAG: nuclear transport factor 2 family protein [Ginsengibacter sp.]
MNLSKSEVLKKFSTWLIAWNEHDLGGVMEFIHEEVVFENWNGVVVSGKSALQKAWLPWFIHHGNFKFIKEDVFFDEAEQKMTFLWRLEWPSLEKFFKGKNEIRCGADILYFSDEKIIKKYTYSKTNIQIDSRIVLLEAPKNEFN